MGISQQHVIDALREHISVLENQMLELERQVAALEDCTNEKCACAVTEKEDCHD